jgi:hypothetical protein
LSADKLREMDLPSQMEALSEATAGMTDKERIGFFTRMFDQRAGTAFVALLGQGSDRLRQVETELRNAGGTATRTATILQDNLAGSLEELGGAWETLKIRAFSSQDGMLKDTVDWLTGMVRFMGAEGFWGTLFDEIAMQLTGFATVQLPMWFMELSEIVAFHAVDIGTRIAFGIAEGLLSLEQLLVDGLLSAVEGSFGKAGDVFASVSGFFGADHLNFARDISEAAGAGRKSAETIGSSFQSVLEDRKNKTLETNKAIHEERMGEIAAEYDADLQYIADSSTARWSALFAEADKSKQAKDDSIPLAANLGAGAENIEAATAGMNEAAQESKALMAIGDSSLPSLNESRFLTGLGSRHKEDLDEAKRHTALLKAILSALGGLPASGGGPGLGIL